MSTEILCPFARFAPCQEENCVMYVYVYTERISEEALIGKVPHRKACAIALNQVRSILHNTESIRTIASYPNVQNKYKPVLDRMEKEKQETCDRDLAEVRQKHLELELEKGKGINVLANISVPIPDTDSDEDGVERRLF